jgi:hypothetical protein
MTLKIKVISDFPRIIPFSILKSSIVVSLIIHHSTVINFESKKNESVSDDIKDSGY